MKIPLPIFILLTCISCHFPLIDFPEKEMLQCDSNCYSVNIHGRVFNGQSENGLTGIPVTLKWYKDYDLFSHTTIGSNTTDASGYFIFDVDIDTTYFAKGYYLDIEIPEQENYLGSKSYGTYTRTYFEVPPPSGNEVNFGLYPSASLHIKLNRVQKDTFDNFMLIDLRSEHYKVSLGTQIENSSHISNEMIETKVEANVPTSIKWTKINNGVWKTENGSITCNDKQNLFQLNY
jgi:hypothetical protein